MKIPYFNHLIAMSSPHVVRSLRAALLLACVAMLVHGCQENTPVDAGGALYGDIEQSAHQQINNYRASRGLPPLIFNATIAAQARAHSRDMAQGRVPFSHNGFDARIAEIQKTIVVKSAAENVAFNNGFNDPATEAVRGWLNSAGHLENIEDDYDLTGIGVDKNGAGDYYFTQIFVKR